MKKKKLFEGEQKYYCRKFSKSVFEIKEILTEWKLSIEKNIGKG